jgi:PAS domain-containing protein
MAQRDIETILTRQLASYLAIPIFLVDMQGTLVFYNESAELLLGLRFHETGEMPIDEWSVIFKPVDEHGAPITPNRLPLVIAIAEQRPAHRRFFIHGLDQTRRHIELTAFPLIGQAGRALGAVALFWEVGAPSAGAEKAQP